MGFHWPPFHLISHLHLHVISSTSQMGWISRGIFKENSYWFVTVSIWTISFSNIAYIFSKSSTLERNSHKTNTPMPYKIRSEEQFHSEIYNFKIKIVSFI